MRARLVVAIGGNAMPADERHLTDLSQFEIIEILGDESGNWETARANAEVKMPEGALPLHYFRDE